MSERLIGIARIAANAPLREAKRTVEYFDLPAQRLLNRCDSAGVPFRWTINPYRGCEFGCQYCYARYTHEFMELRDPLQFEEKIYAKRWNPDAFRSDLARVPRDEKIAIGTATDPYQPAERRYGITRRILEVLRTQRGLSFGLTTKSDLVARDAPLLAEIGRHNAVSVCLTITTLDANLARLLEPRAPRPELRLRALATLASYGVRAGVACSPVMPLLNDSEEKIDALARAVKSAGARGLSWRVLFLRPPALGVFLRFLEKEFPHLHQRYRRRFEKSSVLTGEYPEKITAMLRAIRGRYGLEWDGPPPASWGDPQLGFDLTPQAPDQ
ncbi:MAG: radical SAM protein [Bryobacteraceae bacterium]